MDLRKLKTLVELVAESGIAELEVTDVDGKVRIVRAPPEVMAQPKSTQAACAQPQLPGDRYAIAQ